MAELQPGSGKKQLRRATPTNPSGVDKPQRGARPRRSRRRSWARWMLLDRGYGERRSKLVAEQSRRGKRGRRRRLLLFIAGKGLPGVDSARPSSPRHRLRVNVRRSGEIRSAVTSAWRRRQAERWRLIFEIITELPLRPFFKLLTNFLKKLKISKNESCLIFQTLQLCFKEHFQILPPF